MLLVTAKREAGGADIVPAVARVHSIAPLARQCGKQWQTAVAGRSEGQVHVLERPLQGEFGGEIALFHLVQLGVGDRCVQRAALDGLGQLGVIDAQRPASSRASATPSIRMDM